MGTSTSTRASSWLPIAVTLLAAMATLITCSELSTSKSFCKIHVLPRGYECEELKVFCSDGYILRRVTIRGHLQTSIWEWLKPKLPHTIKMKYRHQSLLAFQGYKKYSRQIYSSSGGSHMLHRRRVVLRGSLEQSVWQWQEPVAKLKRMKQVKVFIRTTPHEQIPEANVPVISNGAPMAFNLAPPSLGLQKLGVTPSVAQSPKQTPISFGIRRPRPSGASVYRTQPTSVTVSSGSGSGSGSLQNSPTTLQVSDFSSFIFESGGSTSESTPRSDGIFPPSSSSPPGEGGSTSLSALGTSSTSPTGTVRSTSIRVPLLMGGPTMLNYGLFLLID